MILQYFKKKENKYKVHADTIYLQILKETKLLVINKKIKDITFNTTFELITIFLVFHIKNLKSDDNTNKKIKEELMKNFVNDIDKSLREFGIGDMSIGKYVKKYVKKFYFRVKILDQLTNDYDKTNKIYDYLYSFKIIDLDDVNSIADELVRILKEIKKKPLPFIK